MHILTDHGYALLASLLLVSSQDGKSLMNVLQVYKHISGRIPADDASHTLFAITGALLFQYRQQTAVQELIMLIISRIIVNNHDSAGQVLRDVFYVQRDMRSSGEQIAQLLGGAVASSTPANAEKRVRSALLRFLTSMGFL